MNFSRRKLMSSLHFVKTFSVVVDWIFAITSILVSAMFENNRKNQMLRKKKVQLLAKQKRRWLFVIRSYPYY